MRLTKVAQAPAQQRQDRHQIQPFHHIQIGRVFSRDHQHRTVDATHGEDDDDRREDQRKNHQAGLHGIGPTDRQEPADKGI
ncbi:hypothetical protein D3C77_657360 [compost metagenome]